MEGKGEVYSSLEGKQSTFPRVVTSKYKLWMLLSPIPGLAR